MNKFLSSDDIDSLRSMVKWGEEVNELGLLEVLVFLIHECGRTAVLDTLESIEQEPN